MKNSLTENQASLLSNNRRYIRWMDSGLGLCIWHSVYVYCVGLPFAIFQHSWRTWHSNGCYMASDSHLSDRCHRAFLLHDTVVVWHHHRIPLGIAKSVTYLTDILKRMYCVTQGYTIERTRTRSRTSHDSGAQMKPKICPITIAHSRLSAVGYITYPHYEQSQCQLFIFVWNVLQNG